MKYCYLKVVVGTHNNANMLKYIKLLVYKGNDFRSLLQLQSNFLYDFLQHPVGICPITITPIIMNTKLTYFGSNKQKMKIEKDF